MRSLPLLALVLLAATSGLAGSPDLTVYFEEQGRFEGAPAPAPWPDAAAPPGAGFSLARFFLDANACHRRLLADVSYAPTTQPEGSLGLRVEMAIDVRDAAGGLVGTARIPQPGSSYALGTVAAGAHAVDLRLVNAPAADWSLRVRGLAAAGEPACAERVLVSEVEANPPGDDAGAEWVELWNAGLFDVDVSGWTVRTLHGAPGERRVGDGTVLAPGARLVVGSPAQWIDNADETVVLVDAFGAQRDRTPTRSDGANDDRSWQTDGAAWSFARATPGT